MRKIIRILTSLSTAALEPRLVLDLGLVRGPSNDFIYDCDPRSEAAIPTEVVWVVLIGADFAGDAQLQQQILQAVNLGERIVGVWAPALATMPIPALLSQYASAVVPWDIQRIREVLCSEVSFLSGSDGEVIKPRPIKRNKC